MDISSDPSNDHPAVNNEQPWGSRRRFVTLRAEGNRESVDLEMPGDQPITSLITDIVKVLGWPTIDADRPLSYQLKTESGEVLPGEASLADSGVENSDVLWIELIEEETPEELASVAKQDGMPAESHREDGPQSGFSTLVSSPSPKDRRGSLAPLRAPRLAIHEPSLVSSKGMVFILGKPPVIIGRQSQGIKPDIDLTDIDPEFISSRKHAEILLEDQGLVLKARKTTNGTFVNGVELRPSQKRILQNGDVIQFGFEGVELVFCSGPGASLPSSFFE